MKFYACSALWFLSYDLKVAPLEDTPVFLPKK